MLRRILIAFVVVVFFVLEASAKTIYIYADSGTCEECIQETESSLALELGFHYSIQRIKAAKVIEGSWRDDAALFVIPGGRATPYALSLNGEGNAQIRQYVENGGALLLICAGGYYGGAYVEFAKGTSLEKLGERELAIFPGKVIGPALADYDYYSESGARAAEITWNDLLMEEKTHESILYYNGGGYFERAEHYPGVRTIANYAKHPHKPAAIVHVTVEKGVAVLSGVHIEYNARVLRRVDKSIEAIHDIEQKRRELFRRILFSLNLNLFATDSLTSTSGLSRDSHAESNCK